MCAATVITRDALLPGLGSLGFGTGWLLNAGGVAGAMKLIDAAYDSGIRMFDTARLYGDGQVEAIVGRAMKARRSHVVLTSKAGILPIDVSFTGRVKRKLFGLGTEPRFGVFAPADLLKSLEQSLRNLQTDVLDLFLLHEVSLQHLQRFDVVPFLQDQVSAGKIKRFGLATSAAESLAITAAFPALRSIVQVSASALDGPGASLAGGSFLVLHSIVASRERALQARLASDPAASARLSGLVGGSPTDAGVIARLLIQLALDDNPTGVTLFFSTRPARIQQAMELATQRQAPVEALALVRSLLATPAPIRVRQVEHV